MTSWHFSRTVPPIEVRTVAIRACPPITKSAIVKSEDAEVDWEGASQANQFRRSEPIVGQIGAHEYEQEIYVTSTDAFVLKNSNLNSFLFADVGTETNGSALTMLSVLARLGQDPWAEAARWTTLPKAAAIDCLAQSINKMPLDPAALAERRATAARLILLLPVQIQTPRQTIRAAITASAMPNWIPIAFLCVSLLMSLAFSVTSAPVAPAGTATSFAQTVDHRAAIARQ